MFENVTAQKLRTFVNYARSAWTQKEAEEIWTEVLWKLNLKTGELAELSTAWTHFVIKGDPAKLDAASANALARLEGP